MKRLTRSRSWNKGTPRWETLRRISSEENGFSRKGFHYRVISNVRVRRYPSVMPMITIRPLKRTLRPWKRNLRKKNKNLSFITGLLLNPLQWEWDKGKGRICVDCTNGASGPDNPGSANTHIPKPSPANPDKCPPVYYASALTRFFVMIWRLRITFPTLDILMHADDIDAAFRRILYSP
jgi:hypothetical protein